MSGRAALAAVFKGTAPRPPYVPLVGGLAARLAQLDGSVFVSDAQAQARALAEAAQALEVDAVTVGLGTSAAVGVDVVARLRPLIGHRAIAACVEGVDVPAARSYCEAGVDLVLLLPAGALPERGVRTLGKACRFYGVPVLLVDPGRPDAAAAAAALGLAGAVVGEVMGDEPGVVGGGLSWRDLDEDRTLEDRTLTAPRPSGFFWSFPGEVPAGAAPERLARLGARLAAGPD